MSTDSEKSQSSLSILSPFDETEEWNKISQIIDSFGADIGTNVKESTTPNNCEYFKNSYVCTVTNIDIQSKNVLNCFFPLHSSIIVLTHQAKAE